MLERERNCENRNAYNPQIVVCSTYLTFVHEDFTFYIFMLQNAIDM